MSGHSKWAGIKHKKAIVDSKKGKVFTKIGREITVAARAGGGNPDHNARLRAAIITAREANMPQDNVKKAIQKGTGEIPGVVIEEILYEGYGPSGVAVLVDVATDNKNRTSSEIRRIFNDYDATLAASGAVSWMFSVKGYIAVDKKDTDEDSLFKLALEAGAEDMKSSDEDAYEIFTEPADFEKVKTAVESGKFPVTVAEITQIPSTTVPVNGGAAEKVISFTRDLEEHEDVKSVYTNFDIPKEILEKVK